MANPNPITAHLTPFPPGVSGNPAGRPRKRQQSEAYEEWLREPLTAERIAKLRVDGIKMKAGATNADVVALAMGNQAIRGNVNAARELREATEGKATQRVELSRGEDVNAPDQLMVVYATAVPGERELPAANNSVIDVTPEEAKAVLDVIAKAGDE